MTHWSNLVLSIPKRLCSTELQVLGTLLPGGTSRIIVTYKSQLQPGHWGVFVYQDQEAKRGINIMAGLINLILRRSRAAVT